MRRVLFVCTGNQCRSAAAEAVLARLAGDAGVEVAVSSSGTHAYDGVPAQPDTVRAAALQGYDLRGHLSREVTAEQLAEADVVLAMARDHHAWLRACFPAARDRIHLFRPYCEGRGSVVEGDDIPDPVTRPLEVHVACVRDIEALLQQLVARWKGDA